MDSDNQFNPYRAPQTVGAPVPIGKPKIRADIRQRLVAAQTVLVLTGILTIVFSAFQLARLREDVGKAVDAQIREVERNDRFVPAGVREDAINVGVRYGRIIVAISIGAGLIYLGLAVILMRFPLPVTIAALALFALDTVALLWLGGTFSILRLVALGILVQAIGAAREFERRRELPSERPPDSTTSWLDELGS